MAKTDQTTDTTFWTVNEGSEEDYWSAYEALRPTYGASGFVEVIYDYHRSKSFSESDGFDTAHDVACGSGKGALELAPRFRHVVATDSNISSVNVMRNRYKDSVRNLEFAQCTAEELSKQYPSRSADMITAAQCFPILDAASALSGFAEVLKPKGTLAIWFYGKPHFTEERYRAICQPIFNRIMGMTFGKVIKDAPAGAKATWKRAADVMASWLYGIDLSSGEWEQVQRWRWNSETFEMGFSPEAVDFPVDPVDRSTHSEQRIEHEDLTFWNGRWNIARVRAYINSSFPDVESKVGNDREIVRLFDELEVAMGGADAERTCSWPVALVLATRSDKERD